MKNVAFAVIVATFENEKAANEALNTLKAERKEKAFTIEDAAIVQKDANGKLHVKETKDSSGGKGAGIGLLLGAAMGLIGGPLGLAAWSAGGVLFGGIAAKLHDSGIKNEELEKIGNDLSAGHSALVVVIDPNWTSPIEKILTAAGAQVSTIGIAAEIAAQLQKAAAEREAELSGGLSSQEGVNAFKSSIETEERADQSH